MKVQIEQVIGGADVRWQVAFKTPMGSARGEWRGPRPVEYDIRDVEIEIEDTLQWGSNVRVLASPAPAGFHSRDGQAIVVGELDTLADDGFVALRLGDALLMLEVEGDPPAQVGALVGVAANTLVLYDANT
jgi:hypothetical protein